MALLEVRDLKKSFGGMRILDNISFSMEEGQAVSIIGSSGSGKTTLLRCLNFLETPDGGTIEVGGEKLFDGSDKMRHSEAEIRRKRLHFGMVFQSFNLFPQYTALENVMLAPSLAAGRRGKGDAGAVEERAKDLLSQMGLSDRLNNYPHQLSGGQQQRVAIARALALSPDILCFDEPTSALDPELTGEVLKVIKELAANRTTMIVVTHEIAFAREVADVVLFMDEGRIVEMGTPSEVIDSPGVERTKQFLANYRYGMASAR